MVKIPLTQGKFALIDDKDFNLVNQYKWFAQKHRNTYYACRRAKRMNDKGKFMSMHRLILDFPDNDVDHKDGNGLNNGRYNLRTCSKSQNQQNQMKTNNGRKTSSIYKGVSWHKGNTKWMACIRVYGKLVHLRYFTSEIEAAKVYNKAAIKYFGEFANLNIF